MREALVLDREGVRVGSRTHSMGGTVRTSGTQIRYIMVGEKRVATNTSGRDGVREDNAIKRSLEIHPIHYFRIRPNPRLNPTPNFHIKIKERKKNRKNCDPFVHMNKCLVIFRVWSWFSQTLGFR